MFTDALPRLVLLKSLIFAAGFFFEVQRYT